MLQGGDAARAGAQEDADVGVQVLQKLLRGAGGALERFLPWGNFVQEHENPDASAGLPPQQGSKGPFRGPGDGGAGGIHRDRVVGGQDDLGVERGPADEDLVACQRNHGLQSRERRLRPDEPPRFAAPVFFHQLRQVRWLGGVRVPRRSGKMNRIARSKPMVLGADRLLRRGGDGGSPLLGHLTGDGQLHHPARAGDHQVPPLPLPE
mmetsp:Transcript_70477/g.187695  ORF Transcript_70477/g.187695 Transcript_70477/m.187695 type:complete len:207 (-) Transcript_70477:721-1341(-)